MGSRKKIAVLVFCCVSISVLRAQSEHLFNIEGEAQGTTYHISYVDQQDRDFQYAIDSLLLEFELSVSTYQPTSIITRINNNDPDVVVDSFFVTCFNKAKLVWEYTNGAFDPTVYPLVNAWGFGPGKKQHIEQKLIDSILQFVGFEKIQLVQGKIIKTDPRVGLDFNAFAQGYSVDVVTRFLKSFDITDCLVEIGGEVYASGKQPNGQNWLIGIEKPIDNKSGTNPLLYGLSVENKGVATSGDYRRFIIEDGVKYAHHLDPKTGYPTKNTLLSATIVSPDCITSDATATAILVMGLKKAKKYLKKHQEIQVFLIYSDKKGEYRFYETSEMKQYLVELDQKK